MLRHLHTRNGFIIIIIGIIVILGIYIYGEKNSENWKSLTAVKGYENLFDKSVNKIVLRKTIDYAEWVEITDSDLIEIWIDFLQKLEIKKEGSAEDRDTNGGHPVIEIWTDAAVYSILLEENNLLINGNIYVVSRPDDIPFLQTYDIAVERHGTKSPWN